MELLRNYFEGTGTGSQSQPTFFLKIIFRNRICQVLSPASHTKRRVPISSAFTLSKPRRDPPQDPPVENYADRSARARDHAHSLPERAFAKKSFFNNLLCIHVYIHIHTHSHQVGCCYCSDTTGRGSHLNLDSTLVLCRSTLEMTANDGNPPFLHPRHMLDQVNLHCCCWFEWLRTTNTLSCPIVSRHSILAKIERL